MSTLAQGSFTAATKSATVLFKGDFNVTLSGTFAATVALERSFDLAATWNPITYFDGAPVRWTAPVSTPFSEVEDGVVYRLNCIAFVSGTVNWRLSQ